MTIGDTAEITPQDSSITENSNVAQTAPAETVPPSSPAGGETAPSDGEATPTTPTPETINLADFGLLEVQDFDSSEFREDFENHLRIFTTQLEQYQQQGGALTAEQRKFLKLYNQVGDRMLDSANGWVIANLVFEQEMMLRLAALGKDIQESIKREVSFPEGNSPVVVQEERVAEGIRTDLEKLKRFISLSSGIDLSEGIGANLNSLIEKLKGPITQAGVELKVTDLQLINLDSLPEEFQNYIKYISPQINSQESQKFLTGLMETRLRFYKQLGMPPDALEGASPWQRLAALSLTQTQQTIPSERLTQAQEKLETNWVRFRNRALQRMLRDGADFTNRQQANEAFFKAQEETIRHFLNQQLLEIIERPQETISALAEKRNRLASPEGREEEKTKRQEELQELQDQVAQWRGEIETTEGEIREKELEKRRLESSQSQLEGRKTANEEILASLKSSLGETRDEKKEEIEGLDQQLQDEDIDKKEKEKIRSQKAELIQHYDGVMADLRNRINSQREKLETVENQLGKIGELGAEINFLRESVQALEVKIGQEENQGALAEIAQLERLVEAGVDQGTERKIAQLEMIQACLERYGTILGQALSPVEHNLTVQDLTDESETAEGRGGRYPSGYLKILDHLFGYQRSSNREEDFRRAREIISPKQLAEILNQSLGLGMTGITDNDSLKQVFAKIKREGIDQPRMAASLIDVLQEIEDRGLKL